MTKDRLPALSLLSPRFSVGVVLKQKDPRAKVVGQKIVTSLLKMSNVHEIYLERGHQLKSGSSRIKTTSFEKLLEKSGVAITIGGDGTILRCTRHLLETENWATCSVIGVNAGKVGFLASLSGDEATKRLIPLLKKPSLFSVEERSCLKVSVIRNGKIYRTQHVLNDCVLSKGSLSRLFEFHIHINGEFVSSYRADGMIVSPPTGSTAYNLAAGGAILQPNIPAIQLTPIAPQAFSNKPIVLSDENEIALTLGKHSSDVYLTFDGQSGLQVMDKDRIVITRSLKSIRFLSPKSGSRAHFFHSLRQKLNWGLVENVSL